MPTKQNTAQAGSAKRLKPVDDGDVLPSASMLLRVLSIAKMLNHVRSTLNQKRESKKDDY